MPFSEFRTKKESEMSPYQKRVQEIDTSILCVAEAEKMIREIGSDLVTEIDIQQKPSFNIFRSRTYLMCFRRKTVF
ncbi:MAG: hypothetical protein NTY51_10130 [Deltaproteobacteria bacterium]|nr:hypothetical protein [Deltaproteobacteria bacterium]